MLEVIGGLEPFWNDRRAASSRHLHEEIEKDASDDHEDNKEDQGLNERRSEIECKDVRPAEACKSLSTNHEYATYTFCRKNVRIESSGFAA